MYENGLKLRLITMDDANLLYNWRNDSLTRMQSHFPLIVNWNEHISWLKSTLKNPLRTIYIAEKSSIPVGTVRADKLESSYELSWTVAPHARKQGVAKQMVALLANSIQSPICAEIKKSNKASVSVAEYVGMSLVRQSEDVLFYARGAL